MASSTIEETLARLREILNRPHTPGWDSRARVDAINAFVDFHYGTGRKGNLTMTFVTLLIKALEHELADGANSRFSPPSAVDTCQ